MAPGTHLLKEARGRLGLVGGSEACPGCAASVGVPAAALEDAALEDAAALACLRAGKVSFLSLRAALAPADRRSLRWLPV